MRQPLVLIVFALLLVALAFRLWPSREESEATFSQEAIEAAVLRMQPALERALDQRFKPPIDVRVVTPKEMAGVLASDLRDFAQEGNERDGADTWAPLLGQNLATMVFAKVELGSSRLNVTPKVFPRLDDMTNGMFRLTSPGFRDVMLLHEMVHVHQMRRIDARQYFGHPETVGRLQARSSVIEGHAQYVAQRVARHLGLDKPFRDLVGVSTGDVQGLPESARRIIRVMSGMQAFPYYRGQELVERVVHDRGYEEGVKALLSEPPYDEIAVVTPSRYLPTPPAAAQFDRAVRRVVRFLAGDSEAEHTAISSLDLRLEWDDVALDRMRKLLEPFVAGDRVHFGSVDTVEMFRCRNEEGARSFMDGIRNRITAGNTPWTDAPIRVESDVTGRCLTRNAAEWPAQEEPWIQKRAVLMLAGAVCIVLRLEDTKLGPGADLRLARRVLELVRSAYSDSPWSHAKGDALAPAFIAALEDPHWGVRWRATRNLGRLPRQTPGVEAAAVRAMSDEDPSVRIAAMDTFEMWDAVGLIPQGVLEDRMDDEDIEVRVHVQLVLERIG